MLENTLRSSNKRVNSVLSCSGDRPFGKSKLGCAEKARASSKSPTQSFVSASLPLFSPSSIEATKRMLHATVPYSAFAAVNGLSM